MGAMSADKAPETAIAVRDLALERGGRKLFAGLSFALAAGGLLLLRGPNGAGKTSLLLTLAGILRPEAGTVAAGDAAEMHLLSAENAIRRKLTVTENLSFWRSVMGPTGAATADALARVGLGGLGDIEAGHMSTGQQRRLALARLLVSRRKIWLLDEPTAALDAAGEQLVADLIGEHLAGGGLAVVATHHDLAVDPAETITLGGLA
jgi:heme exporter protein A